MLGLEIIGMRKKGLGFMGRGVVGVMGDVATGLRGVWLKKKGWEEGFAGVCEGQRGVRCEPVQLTDLSAKQ